MKRMVFLNILSVLLLICLVSNAEIKERRRGKYLRTEVQHTENKEDFSFTMSNEAGIFVKFLFVKRTIVTIHEVRLYEMMQEIVRENAGDGITTRGAVEYVLIPNETYEGEKSTREEIKENGPLANCKLVLEGREIETNEKGEYIDRAQLIIDRFDDLRVKNISVSAVHNLLGERKIEITRNLIKREQVKTPGVAEKVSFDLLEELGMDFTQLRQSGIDGLKVSVEIPEKCRPDEYVLVTMNVENKGGKPVCNLMARSFSSYSELNGKMFYFGNIQPGQKRSFTRMLHATSASGKVCFLSLAVWNILGNVPEAEQKVKFVTE